MGCIFQRKLVRQGNGGLVVTIPISWLRFKGLGKGDEVTIIANDDCVIKAVPKAELKSIASRK